MLTSPPLSTRHNHSVDMMSSMLPFWAIVSIACCNAFCIGALESLLTDWSALLCTDLRTYTQVHSPLHRLTAGCHCQTGMTELLARGSVVGCSIETVCQKLTDTSLLELEQSHQLLIRRKIPTVTWTLAKYVYCLELSPHLFSGSLQWESMRPLVLCLKQELRWDSKVLANISKRFELSHIQPWASWQPRIVASASGVDVFGVVSIQRSIGPV